MRFGLAGASWDLWVRLEPPSDAEGTRFGWQAVRGHGSIENRSFYVLVMCWMWPLVRRRPMGTLDGQGVASLEVRAMILLRGWGFRWMPTGQRTCDAVADALMAWLVQGKLPDPYVNF